MMITHIARPLFALTLAAFLTHGTAGCAERDPQSTPDTSDPTSGGSQNTSDPHSTGNSSGAASLNANGGVGGALGTSGTSHGGNHSSAAGAGGRSESLRVEKVPFENDEDLAGVFLAHDGRIWAAGIHLYERTADGWRAESSADATGFYDLWGSDLRPTLATTRGSVLLYRESNWDAATTIDACAYPVRLAVTDKYAYGACSYYSGMVRIDRKTGETETALGSSFAAEAVLAFADNDVYILLNSPEQELSHYTGGAWADEASWRSEKLPDLGFERLSRIAATEDGDLIAVGQAGLIMRRHDGAWSTEDSGTTEDLNAIYSSRVHGTYAVGANGTIVVNRGARWQALRTETTAALSAVTGRDDFGVVVVGAAGTVLQIR